MSRVYHEDDERDNLDLGTPDCRHGNVPNYLLPSILIMLCCCLPFGIAAIVQGVKVNSLLNQGTYDDAVRASEMANKLCWAGFVLGIFAHALYVIPMIDGWLNARFLPAG